jgi:L-aspartate oxidase
MTELDPEHVKKRFPRIHSTCMQYNIDITTDLVPVRPAAHYAMGGVATDLNGATSIKGLYAAGEVASTGVHGANRLASNSLLEGLVFGARAAAAMITQKPEYEILAPAQNPKPDSSKLAAPDPNLTGQDVVPVQLPPEKIVEETRRILWDKAGIIREGKDLANAVRRLNSFLLPNPGVLSRRFYEARNILEVGRIITKSALARKESRGAHYRSDFPLKDETSPPKHSFATRDAPIFFKS